MVNFYRFLSNRQFKKIALILLAALLTGTLASAQKKEWPKNQINLSLITLANPENPGIELSYERGYGKLSTTLSTSFLTDLFETTRYTNYKGYRFALEEKYFFKTSVNKKVRMYFSLNFAYYQSAMNSEELFVTSEDKDFGDYEDSYIDAIRIKRQAIIVDSRFGVQFLFNHFTIDLGIGLGAVFYDIKHYDRLNPEDGLHVNGPDVDISYQWTAAGQRTALNVPLVVKIGYAF
jgi:hypothetical protein